MNSEELHIALNEFGFTKNSEKEPSYAYEHQLGDGQYLYVKKPKDNNTGEIRVTSTFPLVIHPQCIKFKAALEVVSEITIDWGETKNTSYRRFPKSIGKNGKATSQYGHGVNVASKEALSTLINILTETKTPSLSSNANQDASKGIVMSSEPLNQILFGPPGTGKTYNTTSLAVSIADPVWYQEVSDRLQPDEKTIAIKERYDQLVSERRVMFTTFHQSFSYEDFIEGIRAVSDEQTGTLRYEVQDGIFKQLCASAESKITRQIGEDIDLSGRNIWKMSLGNTLEDDDSIYQECLDNNYVLLGYGDDIDFGVCRNREEIKGLLEDKTGIDHSKYNYTLTSVNCFHQVISKGDIIVISDGNHKFRAIAEVTGDYEFLETEERVGYQQKRSVRWLRQYEPSLPREKLFKKALSQMTLYSLKKQTIDLEKLAVLLAPAKQKQNEQLPHVLIIDEINRGNISRIFGELITLLEDSKRVGQSDAMEVTLPYSKEPFKVPSNVYVIGTMNTADRSLAQLDLALRRRFSFVEMPPLPNLLSGISVHGVSISALLSTMNQRIEVLLDTDHQLGHSYFLSLKGKAPGQVQEAELAMIFSQKIIPLLQEYFFDDWERIGWVLNDPAKPDSVRLIQAGGVQNLSQLFSSSVSEQLSDRRFRINTNAFKLPEAYQGIINAVELVEA